MASNAACAALAGFLLRDQIMIKLRVKVRSDYRNLPDRIEADDVDDSDRQGVPTTSETS